MDDAAARRALAQFGLDPGLLAAPPLARRRKRAVWRAGEHALKWFHHAWQAEKVAAVSHHLGARGLPLPVPCGPIPAERGVFLLFPWLDGRMPTYSEPGMLERITALLARFHLASEGFAEPIEPCMLNWERLWSDERHLLHKVGVLAEERDDPFSLCLREALPWLRTRLRWCQKQLPKTAAAQLAAAARTNPRLGHGDYSRQNLLLRADGSLAVIDLDQVSISLPVRDLSRLVAWVDHDLQGWSSERFIRIINAYGGLTAEEFDLLCLDQIMPHLAVDIAREYYTQARPTHVEELARCLQTDRVRLDDLNLLPA